MSALTNYRTYRAAATSGCARPIGFLEWAIGRIAGHLIMTTSTMARKRGDNAALNHAILAIWAGDTSGGGHPVGQLPPAELSQARRDGRLRLVVDPYISPQA